ncbi:hypothetical protein Ssi03_55430 [Sphaerisporangium siamense]|uniref:Flavin reductase (DIM6/NTAB) family NADH-FMN oxidoreductase RutF n=1 Tax=Sphaerisporangium siamense TaxID=795645 RepID=A0A7W7DAV1_9ACTN|nr:flavin reductase [Sphaerisporangium siamense]MBB4703453.1 flavin reductase (DIM6/NTAB) family NADH-FMN oxidoreductase RutF [Sphaerisporangium siamense]GII87553.1 hypothetical protein Ssi03_55430 [Sphaerisporangium siamense]
MTAAVELSGAEYRDVIGRFASGVTIITTRHDGVDYGMTASAVCSLSLDPPMVVVCVKRDATTGVAIAAGGTFAVNVMSSEQGWLAHRFATPLPDRFAGVGVRREAPEGDPLFEDCLAYLECEVEEEVAGGTHRVFLGRVRRAAAADLEPLTYFRGKFGRFELEQHAQAYRDLYRMVVERALPLHEPLAPAALAERLGIPVSAAFHALVRLTADGLVHRDPERGFLQVVFKAEQAIESYEVKRILDMAVVELTVGAVPEEGLRRLEELCDRANELVDDEHGVLDVAAYRERALRFQEAMIGLTGNATLVATFRTLRIPELISLPHQIGPATAPSIAANRRRIVDGYLAGDPALVRAALLDQYELCKSLTVAYIGRSGGEL